MTDFKTEILHLFLEEASEMLEDWESCCFQIEKEATTEVLNEIFRIAHNMKGSAKSVELNALADFIHQVEDVIELMRSGDLQASSEVVALLLDCQTYFSKWFGVLAEDRDATIPLEEILERINAVKNGEAKTEQSESAAAQGREANEAQSAETHVDVKSSTQATPGGQALAAKAPPAPNNAPAAAPAAAKSNKKNTRNETIRISVDKLDELFRIVGELSIQNEILYRASDYEQIENPLMRDAIELLNKGFSELQDQTLSLRLQPVETLFKRLESSAMEVARKVQRKIVVEMQGETLELDKSVLEQMKDPLVHIIRNAVDHGVEPPQEREQAGKDPTAKVMIKAEARPGGLLLIIADDGKGLSREKIMEKALSKGLISDGIKPDAMADHEVFQLLFAPGFSTAEAVTEFSGRGVGLDVVKKAVEDLKGSIVVKSQFGKGSAFEVLLPTTMNIMDAILVEVANVTYAVPIPEISEIVNLDEYDLKETGAQLQSFQLRDKVVPVQSLSQYLPGPDPSRDWYGDGELQGVQKSDAVLEQVQEDEAAENDGIELFDGLELFDDEPAEVEVKQVVAEPKKPLVVDAKQKTIRQRLALLCSTEEDRSVAFEIDRIVGQQSIVLRELGEKTAKIPGVSGGTILSNGEPGLIINLIKITNDYVASRSSDQPLAQAGGM